MDVNPPFPGSSDSVAEQAISQVQTRARSRQQQRPRPAHSERTVRLVLAMNRAVYRVARHWLLVVNSFLFVYLLQLFLAPIFAASGHRGLARPLYAFNGIFCHQDPERSFFVFGQKMACCQRCAAIYIGMFLLGLGFVACRHRLRVPSWRTAGLLAIPVVVDGGAQLIGIHESTAALRVATGALFAGAVCWVMFPYLENGFAAMRIKIEERFARLVAEGRAQPL
jgi:uncharacterized membrane protein